VAGAGAALQAARADVEAAAAAAASQQQQQAAQVGGQGRALAGAGARGAGGQGGGLPHCAGLPVRRHPAEAQAGVGADACWHASHRGWGRPSACSPAPRCTQVRRWLRVQPNITGSSGLGVGGLGRCAASDCVQQEYTCGAARLLGHRPWARGAGSPSGAYPRRGRPRCAALRCAGPCAWACARRLTGAWCPVCPPARLAAQGARLQAQLEQRRAAAAALRVQLAAEATTAARLAALQAADAAAAERVADLTVCTRDAAAQVRVSCQLRLGRTPGGRAAGRLPAPALRTPGWARQHSGVGAAALRGGRGIAVDSAAWPHPAARRSARTRLSEAPIAAAGWGPARLRQGCAPARLHRELVLGRVLRACIVSLCSGGSCAPAT
jgi:hypothetical protein